MKLLLDTVTFLDLALGQGISQRTRDLVLAGENELFVSIASCWEIALKYSAGKLALPQSPRHFVPLNREKLAAELLPIDEECVLHIPLLPPIHKDPFDRILISQAIIHGMVL